MDDLAREYWGRIKVARFMAKTRYFDVPSPEINERYDIVYIPTVILFDKGVEVDRWRLVVMEDVYRYDLNKFLKARAAKEAKVGKLPGSQAPRPPQPPPFRETTGTPAGFPYVMPRPSGGTITEK